MYQTFEFQLSIVVSLTLYRIPLGIFSHVVFSGKPEGLFHPAGYKKKLTMNIFIKEVEIQGSALKGHNIIAMGIAHRINY